MLEVELNVIAANIRSHGDDWRSIELSNQMASRDTIEVWHYYVH